MSYELICGDALTVLRTLPAESVQCCVTSPPYFGLRDYGTATWEGGDAGCQHVTGNQVNMSLNRGKLSGETHTSGVRPGNDNGQCRKCGARRIDQQIGLEESPEAYCAKLVEVFREVRRVLRDDGTLWLNLGDSFWGGKGKSGYELPWEAAARRNAGRTIQNGHNVPGERVMRPTDGKHSVIKPKDLIGIPWLVAFALRADGWYLRSEIIWHKRAPMPESVTDRCTKAHEQVFLLAKSASYFYDAEAIAEQATQPVGVPMLTGQRKRLELQSLQSSNLGTNQGASTRNKRSVWTLGPESYSGAHFATMPTKLVEPCILAGTSERGCCSACGAPWVRVVERQPDNTGYANGPGGHKRYQNVLNGGNGSSTLSDIARYRSSTLDWRPSCSCNAGVVPCTVLDPFSGSGTTGAVALKHHRHYVGIDLNADYIELAHKRIGQSQPMLLDVTA